MEETFVITAKTEPHSTRSSTLVILTPESGSEETIMIPPRSRCTHQPLLSRLLPWSWRVVVPLMLLLLFLTVTGLLIG